MCTSLCGNSPPHSPRLSTLSLYSKHGKWKKQFPSFGNRLLFVLLAFNFTPTLLTLSVVDLVTDVYCLGNHNCHNGQWHEYHNHNNPFFLARLPKKLLAIHLFCVILNPFTLVHSFFQRCKGREKLSSSQALVWGKAALTCFCWLLSTSLTRVKHVDVGQA